MSNIKKWSVVIVLAVLLAALALSMLRQDDAKTKTTPTTSQETGTSPPHLVAAKRPSDLNAPDATVEPGETPSTQDSLVVTISGVITAVDTDAPIEGAEVYVVRGQAEYHLIATSNSGPDGTYSIACPVDEFGEAKSKEIVLGVIRSGFLRRVRMVGLGEQHEQIVDFQLTRGASMVGQVSTEDGTPVSDIRVFVSSTPHITRSGRTDKYFRFHELRYARLMSKYYETYAETDSQGRFIASGLGADARYTVRSADRRWFILQSGNPLDLRNAPHELIAVPALSIRIQARNKATGELLEAFGGSMAIKVKGTTGYSMPLRAEEGATQITWKSFRKGAELVDGFHAHLEIRAPMMSTAKKSVVFGPGVRTNDVVVELEPLEPGWATVVALDSEGNHVTFPLVATLVARERGSSKNALGAGDYPAQRLTPIEGSPGSYRLKAGVGKWWASIRPDIQLGIFVGWKGALSIPARPAEGTVNVTIPATGTVRFVTSGFRHKFRNGTARVLMTRRNPGASTAISLISEDQLVQGFPPGKWSLRINTDECQWQSDVLVEPYSETIVNIDD